MHLTRAIPNPGRSKSVSRVRVALFLLSLTLILCYQL
jgi:hypothetical protein